jgi:hypothetical protein
MINAALALLIVIAPFVLMILSAAISDYIRKSKESKQRKGKADKDDDIQSSKKKLMARFHAGLSDSRLISEKFEKKDKWGINVAPSPLAPSWRYIQYGLLAVALAFSFIGISSMNIFMIVVSLVISSSAFGLIIKHGGEKIKSEDKIYERIIGVLRQHMHVEPNTDPRDIIKIDQWTVPEEPQVIADARVKAKEDGEFEELSKDLPNPDKKGRIKQPRISKFRTTPLSMVIDFPVSFRQSSTDDTISHLNESFGGKTEWVSEREVKDPKTGKTKIQTGWDFEQSKAYLKTVPPLPLIAKLPEDFDKGPYNQIKLGATISGECIWDINKTPMSLIPLAIDTLVWVKVEDHYETRMMKDIIIGDTVVDGIGRETTVRGTTPRHIPESMYAVTFKDYGGEYQHHNIFTVHAADDHLWPIDVYSTDRRYDGMESDEFSPSEATEEASTDKLYDLARKGVRAVLQPVFDGNRMIRWTTYSVSYEKPREVMCINVESSEHAFMLACSHDVSERARDIDEVCSKSIPTHNCGSTGGGKSVLQRNIVFSCIARSDDIKFLGIDLKQVELSKYSIFSDAVLGIGTTLEDAVEILRFANDTMQSRYTSMKKMGYNDFKSIPNHGPAIMVMIDEAGQLLDMSGGKGSDTAKAEQELKGEAQSIIGQIARLGRAAGVHLAIATQRPDAKMIPGELKENLMFRAGCGHLTSIASSMLFDDNTGMNTPADPKGRAAAMVVGQKPEKMQVYFTKDADWMIEWMKRHGKNPDNTPIETGPSVNIDNGIDKLRGKNVDETLGIDNSKAVDEEVQKRQAAAKAHEEAVRKMKSSHDDDDDFELPTDDEPESKQDDSIKRPNLKGDAEVKHDPRDDWDDEMNSIIDDE